MSWHGSSGGEAAAKAGHKVVMTPTSTMYFDFTQFADNDGYEYIGGFVPFRRVYQYDPCGGIEQKYWGNVLGVQGNLWSEFIWGEDDLQWKAFIRGLSLAETQWTELKNKDWTRFLTNVALVEYDRLKLQGFNAAPISLGPKVGWESGSIPTSWISMQWTVTGALKSTGDYEIAFLYSRGKNGLRVRNVKLFIGGSESGSDSHEGLAFDPSVENIWKVHSKIDAGDKSVTIQAQVMGAGGVDSSGRVIIYHA
jgi:hypothetical protein